MFSKFLQGAAAALITLGLSAAPSAAQSPTDNLGRLGEVVLMGDEEVWSGSLTGGWYMLQNQTKPSAVRYYFANAGRLDATLRKFRLNVAVRGGGGGGGGGEQPAHAGLLFNFNSQSQNYMGLTIASNGDVSVWVRDENGLQLAGTSQSKKARLDGTDILEIQEVADSAGMFLNGENVFSVNGPDGFTGAYGIIAIGAGQFAFDALEVATEGASGGSSDPAPFPPPNDQQGAVEEPAPAAPDQRTPEDAGPPPLDQAAATPPPLNQAEDATPPPLQPQNTGTPHGNFFVGSWTGSVDLGEGPFRASYTYGGDNSFQAVYQTPYGPLSIRGGWRVEQLGGQDYAIAMTPQTWDPRQLCDNAGNCQPVYIDPERVFIRVLDQNTVDVEGEIWRRAPG